MKKVMQPVRELLKWPRSIGGMPSLEPCTPAAPEVVSVVTPRASCSVVMLAGACGL